MSARRFLALPAAVLLLSGCGVHDLGSAIAKAQEMKQHHDEREQAAAEAVENIGPRDEVAVGQAASMALIAEYGGLVNDKELTDYVNDVGNLVAQHSTRISVKHKDESGSVENGPRMKSRRFTFGVLGSDEINAFSLPGGYVYVTRGLLSNLTSEADLAFVLGHEVSHVDQEHDLEMLIKQVRLEAKAMTFLKEQGAGVIGKSLFDNPKFFARAVQILDSIKKGKANPEQERVADAKGLEIAMASGYDPRGAERVLDLLATQPTRPGYDTPAQRKQALASKTGAKGALGVARFQKMGAMELEAALASTP